MISGMRVVYMKWTEMHNNLNMVSYDKINFFFLYNEFLSSWFDRFK